MPGTDGLGGLLLAKALVTALGMLLVGAYFCAALYQLHLADRVHLAPDSKSDCSG